MQLLIMTANYELCKQNSFYITKYAEKSYLHVGPWGFQGDAQNNPFSNIILSQFVAETT